jgi:uncharacterized damage-inducible protein DinB
MPRPAELRFPAGDSDERSLLLSWLDYLRHAVVRKTEAVSDEDARWRPAGTLLSLAGVVNHLTHVEWRWIDGGMRGESVSRSEEEFTPPSTTAIGDLVAAYEARAEATNDFVRAASSLAVPCEMEPATDLRWVLLHLINETARHAGHADATRELLDGATGA